MFKKNNIITKILAKYIPPGTTKERFVIGVFWSFASTVLSRILNLIAFIIIARILGKTTYGEFGIVQSTLGMFITFASLGLGITNTKYIAEYKLTDLEKVRKIIALSELSAFSLGVFIMVLYFFSANYLATAFLNAPYLAKYLQISAIGLLFSALLGVQNGALAGFEAFRTLAKINFISGLLSFPILILGLLLGDFEGVVWAYTFTIILNWGMNKYYLEKEIKKNGIKFNFKGCLTEVSILYKFTFPAFISGLIITPIIWLCNTFLVKTENGYAEMGIYNAANQVLTVLLVIPNIISQVMMPILSEKFGLKDFTGSKNIILKSIKLNFIILFPLAILLSFGSDLVISLYGKQFSGSNITFIIIFFTAVIYAIQIPIGNLIAASNKMWLGLLMNLSWGAIFIFSTIQIIYRGAEGLALARLIAYLVHFIYTYIFFIYILRKK